MQALKEIILNKSTQQLYKNIQLNTYIISATGPDRLGIVNNLTQKISEIGGNIKDSNMQKMGNTFNIMLEVEFPNRWNIQQNGLKQSFKNEFKDLNLNVNVYQTEQLNLNSLNQIEQKLMKQFNLKLTCHDDKSMIFSVTNVFIKFGINILSLNSRSFSAPIVGYQMFEIQCQSECDANLDLNEIKSEINKLGEKFQELDFQIIELD